MKKLVLALAMAALAAPAFAEEAVVPAAVDAVKHEAAAHHEKAMKHVKHAKKDMKAKKDEMKAKAAEVVSATEMKLDEATTPAAE